MARQRYIKTKSNYTIKQLHQSTDIGNIYERDFMTIADLNTYAPGSAPSYSLNGFKMVVNDGVSLKKKHQHGLWLKNESCDKNSSYWSLGCMGNDEFSEIDKEVKLELKPNYTSLLDFAYFGSARKLVESSFYYILNFFPGEIHLLDTYIEIDGKRLFHVENPFNIDMESIMFPDEKIENPLRVFSVSYDRYKIINTNSSYDSLTWEREILTDAECTPNNTQLSVITLGNPFGNETPLRLFSYNINGVKQLYHDGTFTGCRIRPNNNEIAKFFDNLDDFQNALLNRKTDYTISLITPSEDDYGFHYKIDVYTWPKSGEWNIAISGREYETYLNSLLSIADFYDAYDSDNLWRSMTHEAIVAYDWTLTKQVGDEVIDEYDSPNSQRIKSFIHIAGRQFDELKKYVDGITHVNAVTYDEYDNNPDLFLSDTLTNYGWDVCTPIPSKLGKYMTLGLYPTHKNGYTSQDANYEFYRRLLLNSGAILSAKGTKKSIEMILSLFGYKSLNFVEHSFHDIIEDGKVVTRHWDELNDEQKKKILCGVYDMTEYVYVASSGSTAFQEGGAELIKEVNSYKATYDDENRDKLQGLPVREVLTEIQVPVLGLGWNDVTKTIDTGVTVGYETQYTNYLIPWFERNRYYDSNVYFESKGGWGLIPTKRVSTPEYGDVYIETNDNFRIYDEHVNYLKFQNNISNLKSIIGEYPSVGDVYYIYDISDQAEYDWGLIGTESQPTMSHYFILKNAEKDNILGVIRDENGEVLLESENEENFDITSFSLFENAINISGETSGDTNIGTIDEPLKKQYGWKNISEEELREGKSEDAQKVFYLESLIENKLGNAPHTGRGNYDDGDEYRVFYEDLFSGAKINELFDYVDDTLLPWSDIFENENFKGKKMGFEMVKSVDNIKCWYFTDTTINSNLFTLTENGDGTYNVFGIERPSVGNGEFVRFYSDEYRDTEGDGSNGIFNSRQYPIMTPYNMEGGSEDDEAAANSIVNSKGLYIEFMPDLKSPDTLYEYVNDIVMHYAKQIIPSTTLFKYKVPMSGLEVFCSHRTYPQSVFNEN